MPKDYLVEAEKQISKAELYFDAKQYKRAGKLFNSAGDLFFKENKNKAASDCYLNAATSFISEKKYEPALDALKNAGDCSILINEYSNAGMHYKKVLKYLPNIKKIGERDHLYLLFSALSYLCLFVEGKQDQGFDLIKQIKKNVDDDFFKESPLIGLVKNLTIAIRDKNDEYIDKIGEDYHSYKFSKAEIKLLKEVMVIAYANVSLKINLSIDKEQYTTKDSINFEIDLDSKPLLKISETSFYNYKVEKLKIINIGLELSDNISIQKKPKLPTTLNVGENYVFNFVVKPHFQVDEPFIGPISLTCELDEKFQFFRQESEIIKPKIISPPPSLNISLKNLRPPLIGQTFPLEILVENNSKGDALELNIDVEFPKEIKIIRGTTKKQIYSLPSNDKITWEINLKPLEAGDYQIKMDIIFKDPDQNLIEDTQSFPFSIKL